MHAVTVQTRQRERERECAWTRGRGRDRGRENENLRSIHIILAFKPGQKLTGNMWHARVTPKNMLHNCWQAQGSPRLLPGLCLCPCVCVCDDKNDFIHENFYTKLHLPVWLSLSVSVSLPLELTNCWGSKRSHCAAAIFSKLLRKNPSTHTGTPCTVIFVCV